MSHVPVGDACDLVGVRAVREAPVDGPAVAVAREGVNLSRGQELSDDRSPDGDRLRVRPRLAWPAEQAVRPGQRASIRGRLSLVPGDIDVWDVGCKRGKSDEDSEGQTRPHEDGAFLIARQPVHLHSIEG